MSDLARDCDYRQLARREAILDFAIDPASLTRLSDVSEGLSSVDIHLRFERDDQNRCRVHGDVSARLELQCQRCLKPVPCAVAATIDVAVVADERSARQFGKRADVFVAGGDRLNVAELIEDDLLLSLPVDRCQTDPCPNAPALAYPPQPSDPKPADPEISDDDAEGSPFAVLQRLKNESSGD